jgi:hypothetical protein
MRDCSNIMAQGRQEVIKDGGLCFARGANGIEQKVRDLIPSIILPFALTGVIYQLGQAPKPIVRISSRTLIIHERYEQTCTAQPPKVSIGE